MGFTCRKCAKSFSVYTEYASHLIMGCDVVPCTMEIVHVRTCQDCGHQQAMRDPSTLQGESWREAKCRRCHSESMDFGSSRLRDELGRFHPFPDDDDEEDQA